MWLLKSIYTALGRTQVNVARICPDDVAASVHPTGKLKERGDAWVQDEGEPRMSDILNAGIFGLWHVKTATERVALGVESLRHTIGDDSTMLRNVQKTRDAVWTYSPREG